MNAVYDEYFVALTREDGACSSMVTTLVLQKLQSLLKALHNNQMGKRTQLEDKAFVVLQTCEKLCLGLTTLEQHTRLTVASDIAPDFWTYWAELCEAYEQLPAASPLIGAYMHRITGILGSNAKVVNVIAKAYAKNKS